MTQDEMMKYFSGLTGADYSNKKPFFKFALKGDENFDPNFASISEQFQPFKDAANNGYNAMMEKAKSKEQVNPYENNNPAPMPGSDEYAEAMKEVYSKDNTSVEYMNDEQRKSNNKKTDTSGPTDEQRKSGGQIPKKEKKEGVFNRLWNKFTDKDSSAPRNLLDFGLAMMANSKGAGNDFLGTVAQSVGDTVDKVDARKLAALETAKDNLAGKLERTKTISEIEDNIVDRYTSETENEMGVKTSVTDWASVAAAMDELDPNGDYFSKDYITEVAKNGFGMPALNEDGQYELEVPTKDSQIFKYATQMKYISMMNPDKKPEDIEVVVGNRVMSLKQMIEQQLNPQG